MESHREAGPMRAARLGDPRQRRTIRMTDSTTHIVFLLFPGITQLDFTAPAQALCRMPGAVLAGAAASLDPIARSEERRVGKSVSVRVDLGGRRIIKKTTHTYT